MPAEALAAEVRRDLERLGLPARHWTAREPGGDLLDVLVVGAGMCGIAAAAALAFKGVRNLALIDQASHGLEGPWRTTARMRTLRSPKHLPGIALGIPSLSFRAWYEATRGLAAWDALYKIANDDWMDYLVWLTGVLALPLSSGVALRLLDHEGAHLLAELSDGRVLRARHVVLATGRDGAGGPNLPALVDRALWPEHAAHTAEAIDFTRLRGKRGAVLGAGSSGWDAAATALEQGARAVDMYCRRARLPQFNKGRGSTNPGYFEGWASLSDAERWQLMAYMHDEQSPPPHESVHRALAHPGFRLHLASPVEAAGPGPEGVALRVAGQPRGAGFLVLATGFAVDLARRPELAALLPHIATWADAYTPPPALARPELGRFPYLDEGFAATPRGADAPAALAGLHLFNHAATLSLGAIASDIPGVSTAAERLSGRIAAALFRADFPVLFERLRAFDEPELESTPYFVALRP